MSLDLNIVALLLDIGVCAALILSVISGVKRGLINSLLGIVIVVLALIGASWCAGHFTQPVAEWLEPIVMEKIVTHLQQEDTTGLSTMVQQLLEQLRGLTGQTGQSTLLSGSVASLLYTVVYAAVYLVSFLLLLFLLWLVSNPLKLASKLPVVRGLDNFGGGALGLISGAAVVSVALWALQKVGWPSAALLNSTYIAKYFARGWLMEIFSFL